MKAKVASNKSGSSSEEMVKYGSARNYTRGNFEPAEHTLSGEHMLNYPETWERSSDAIEHTPYMKYQNNINGRNAKTMSKNLHELKQD